MRRDVRTDWTVRDDVRAKLRSSIRRLLVKHDSPGKPAAIKLVMEQMECAILQRGQVEESLGFVAENEGVHVESSRVAVPVPREGRSACDRVG